MNITGIRLLVSVALALTPLSSIYAQGTPIVEATSGVEPPLEQESHAVQGEAVYSEFDYVKQKAAVLQASLEDGKVSLLGGQVMLGFRDGEQERYCYYDESWKTFGMSAPHWVCLIAAPNQTFVARYLLANGAAVGRRKALNEPVAFKETTATLPTEAASSVVGRRMFRNEILYQGAAGQVLRLLYREFTNDLARPAFSQELTYDLPEDGPLTVAVKGARLEVLEAGNQGIRYRVLKGFD